MRGTGTFYARLLRLRHLRLAPVTTFVLFEGSFMVALVLALAEIINGWGILVVPVAVAIMVKLNDVVAGVLNRPVAIAQLNTGRMVPGPAIGFSPMPRPARVTSEIGNDDAVPDPLARPSRPVPRPGVARGTAAVPGQEHRSWPLADPSVHQPRSLRTGESETGPRPGPTDGRNRGNQGRFST